MTILKFGSPILSYSAFPLLCTKKFQNIGILWISRGWQHVTPVLFVRPNIIRIDIDLTILLAQGVTQ